MRYIGEFNFVSGMIYNNIWNCGDVYELILN